MYSTSVLKERSSPSRSLKIREAAAIYTSLNNHRSPSLIEMPPKVPNLVYAKKVVGSVLKNGKEIIVSAATETSLWKRPEEAADKIGKEMIDNSEDWVDQLPEGTKEVCFW